MCVYIYTHIHHVCVYMCVCVYIYIYIYYNNDNSNNIIAYTRQCWDLIRATHCAPPRSRPDARRIQLSTANIETYTPIVYNTVYIILIRHRRHLLVVVYKFVLCKLCNMQHAAH